MFKEVYIKTNAEGFADEEFEELYTNVNVVMNKEHGVCAIQNAAGVPLFMCMFGNIDELIIKNI